MKTFLEWMMTENKDKAYKMAGRFIQQPELKERFKPEIMLAAKRGMISPELEHTFPGWEQEDFVRLWKMVYENPEFGQVAPTV